MSTCSSNNALARKVLVANRGEIALRIVRACKSLNIACVAVYTLADRNSLHARYADHAVCIGEGPAASSYLCPHKLISAALLAGADAVHPGYGFLSENADFAQKVIDAGLMWIGPKPTIIRTMGDKVSALITAREHNIPTVPGSGNTPLNDEATLHRVAESLGYPLLIKASAGGGGKGITRVNTAKELSASFKKTQDFARHHFKDPTVYLEKFLTHPRHIELQMLADHHGNARCVGERDCSLQRRQQKIIEEGPTPHVCQNALRALRTQAELMLSTLGYVGAGTLEFLYQDKRFYFIEMNTRIQVEHPVTEMSTGCDLITQQLKLHANQPLEPHILKKPPLYAIECRVNAEHPETFAPSPGLITRFHAPSGAQVRVDSILYAGYQVPHYYDSLVAKITVAQPTRKQAIAAMRQALHECVVEGINTNLPLLKRLMTENFYVDNAITIHSISQMLQTETVQA